LALGQARADALEIGRKITLEPLLGERPAMAQQAQADLPVGDDRPAPRRIALGARQRGRYLIARKSRSQEKRQYACANPHTSSIPGFFSGTERMRLPVARENAFNTAGPATQLGGAPIPPRPGPPS